MIMKYRDMMPKVDETAFTAENASVIGDVVLEKNSSVWFGAVLRGDSGRIVIGEGSNVQDNATVHCDRGTRVVLGKNVTVGHNAIVHGAEVCDNVMIGMGATVMNNVRIGRNSIIGAGALVPAGTEIPEGSLAVGVPAKVIKKTSPGQIEMIAENAEHYRELAARYREETR